jgi:hypothetical protein
MGYEYDLQGTDPAGDGPAVPPNSKRIAAVNSVVELVHGPPVIVAYETAAGTKVFHAGSMQYSNGLDSWAGLSAFRKRSSGGGECHPSDDDCFENATDAAQQMTINILADMNAFPHSPRGPFVVPVTSCDWNAPDADCIAGRR